MRESRRSDWEKFWEAKRNTEDVYSNGDRIIRNLKAVVDIKGKKILEIGAGTGRDSFPLAREGAVVYQLDYSDTSLAILKELAQQQGLETHIVGGDAFNLPFPEGTFDVVFHQGLLEHFRKPVAEKLLRENVRVLKPGGLLMVDVPQRYHVYTPIKHLLITLGVWFAGWERSFSVRELRAFMRRVGVDPVYSYGEWMYPSFYYRVLREVARKVGIPLPLYPALHPALRRLREKVRRVTWKTPLPLYTGISIGVIGKK